MRIYVYPKYIILRHQNHIFYIHDSRTSYVPTFWTCKHTHIQLDSGVATYTSMTEVTDIICHDQACTFSNTP